jgi:hypothetical protein
MGKSLRGLDTGLLLTPSQLWFLPPCGRVQPPDDGAATDVISSVLSSQERSWGAALPPLRRGLYWRSRRAMRLSLGAVLDLPPRQVPLHSPPWGAPPAAQRLRLGQPQPCRRSPVDRLVAPARGR